MGRWSEKISKSTDTVPTKPTKPTKQGCVSSVGTPCPCFQKKNYAGAPSTHERNSWLTPVAELLELSPDHLLEHGLIEPHDLEEQFDVDPAEVVKLIKSNPKWHEVEAIAHRAASLGLASGTAPIRPPRASGCHDIDSERRNERKPNTLTQACFAAAASPEWRYARDQYVNHLMGCRSCHAPVGRYCATGSDLRQQYNHTPQRYNDDEEITGRTAA
ncbi:hypothetical protein LCGC14_0047220 [marine sediment metagenome]|uniref:Uncharacterized protein n=1 Tax=marine sediment metagenome TaxID=412755 RepID=A0A0F9W6Y0_9ZZZZ